MTGPAPAARRVAALCDIHGNLPALEAVLAEVQREGVERIVIGGDVVPGPQPRETLERLLALGPAASFLHGNCERAVLAQWDAPDADSATYWGTTSGRPLPPADRARMRWTAMQLTDHRALLASWPRTVRLRIEGLGEVLFCHATPRSETEIVLRTTSEERLRPVFAELDVSAVVCGHTHMQFDRVVGGIRVVNAGSVGMPFGGTGACWALLGPDIELRRASYDVARAADRVRASGRPMAEEDARSILHPPTEEEMVRLFSAAEVGSS